MVGIGRATGYSFGTLGYPLGFNLYAFQARARRGKLLATGLNLVGDNPEAVYLLDQFIRYVRSEKLLARTFDIAQHQQEARRRQELCGTQRLGSHLAGQRKNGLAFLSLHRADVRCSADRRQCRSPGEPVRGSRTTRDRLHFGGSPILDGKANRPAAILALAE